MEADSMIPVLWLILLILIPILRQAPLVSGLKDFSDDARLYIFTLWKDIDPSLFVADPISDYVRRSMMPPGYTFVASNLASFFEHPLPAMHLLTIILAIVLAVSCFLIGFRLIGLWGACISVALILQSNSVWSFLTGGFPKSFGLPFVAATVAAWLYGRERFAVLLQCLSGFFYPPVYALLALTGGLRILLTIRSGRFEKMNSILFVVGNAAVVLILSVWIQSNPFGPNISGDSLRSDPHWIGEHRRYKDYPFDPIRAEVLTKGVFPSLPENIGRDIYDFLRPFKVPILVGVLLLLILLIRMSGLHRLRSHSLAILKKYSEMSLLFFAVMFLYGLARIFELHLFMPNRYLALGYPLLISIFTAALLMSLINRMKLPIFRKVLLFTLAICSVAYEITRDNYGFTKTLPSDSQPVLEKVSELPRSSMIYATGDLANDIPLFAARSVLWNYETYQVYHLGYVKQTDERIRKIFDCLLNPDWENAKKELDQIPVTHLIYDKELWQNPDHWEDLPRESWILLSPLWEEYKRKLADAARHKRLLWDVIPERNAIYDGRRYKIWTVN